jgi:hypothetical protein
MASFQAYPSGQARSDVTYSCSRPGVVRPGSKELLQPLCQNEPERQAVDAWVGSLTDYDVVARYDRFSRAAVDKATLYEASRQLIRKAVRSQASS